MHSLHLASHMLAQDMVLEPNLDVDEEKQLRRKDEVQI